VDEESSSEEEDSSSEEEGSSSEDEEAFHIIWKRKGDGGDHTEKQLIARLKRDDRLKDGKNVSVRVFTNNSPCKDCALKLMDFFESRKSAYIRIYAANLYNIKRKSCMKKKEGHVEFVSDRKSDRNAEGLKELNELSNCEMGIFNREAWYELIDRLQIRVKYFYKQYDKKSKGNDRSRRREDKRLKKDLQYILNDS
jgi:hypothetical protein